MSKQPEKQREFPFAIDFKTPNQSKKKVKIDYLRDDESIKDDQANETVLHGQWLSVDQSVINELDEMGLDSELSNSSMIGFDRTEIKSTPHNSRESSKAETTAKSQDY